jgi:arylsulfatase A-like enzyme
LTVDYAPTFLEAAGISYKDNTYDGASLVGELTGAKQLSRDAIYFHYPHYAWHRNNDMGSIIREGDLKLIHKFEKDEYELYNLKTDISESNNLIKQMPEKAAQLKRKLLEWKESTGAENPRLKAAIPEDELGGRKN